MALLQNFNTDFSQPLGEFTTRKVNVDEETIDYLPGHRYRIWLNNLTDSYTSHKHSALEIILCSSNTYSVTVREQTYKMHEGDIIFLPPNVPHTLTAPEKGERFILLFDYDIFNMFNNKEEIDFYFSVPHLLKINSGSHIYPFVYSSIHRIIQHYFANEKMSELHIYSELFRTVSLICDSEERGPDEVISTHSDMYDKFINVLSYIDTNYTEDLTLEMVADTTGFSKYHFARLFKQYTDTTFYDYLCSKRIMVAKQLLRKNIPVTEVAFQIGFNNLTTFCRCFKKYAGCSPTQYKSNSAKEEETAVALEAFNLLHVLDKEN